MRFALTKPASLTITRAPVSLPQLVPSPERALSALDRAIACARKGAPDRPLEIVSKEDFDAARTALVTEVRARLDVLMMSEHVEDGLDALLASGALAALLPDVEALVGFGDGEWRHKDVWRHTKQVVQQAAPKLEVKWGALLHDIGKVRTRTISETGEVHFFGHAEVGARMFDKLERRRGLFAGDPALRDEIRFLILHHLRAGGYENGWTDSAVRRFGKEMGPYLEDLLCLARADITTKRPEKKRHGLRQIDDLAARLAVIQGEDAKVPPLPKGLGTGLMTALGLSPSPRLGQLMRALEDEAERGDLRPHQPVEHYVDHVLANRTRYGV